MALVFLGFSLVPNFSYFNKFFFAYNFVFILRKTVSFGLAFVYCNKRLVWDLFLSFLVILVFKFVVFGKN